MYSLCYSLESVETELAEMERERREREVGMEESERKTYEGRREVELLEQQVSVLTTLQGSRSVMIRSET